MRVVAVAAVLALVAGASATAGGGPVRTCGESIGATNETPTVRSNDLLIGHRLVLIGAAGTKTRTFDSGTKGWFWLKSLAAVRSGRVVTLTVPRRQRGRFRLRYANRQRWTASVTFHTCASGEWSYFPGGFIYRAPGCYAFDVRMGRGHAMRHHV